MSCADLTRCHGCPFTKLYLRSAPKIRRVIGLLLQVVAYFCYIFARDKIQSTVLLR